MTMTVLPTWFARDEYDFPEWHGFEDEANSEQDDQLESDDMEVPDISFSKAKLPVIPHSRGPAEAAPSHIALVRLMRFFNDHCDRNELYDKWWNNEFTEPELELLGMLESHRRGDHQVLRRMRDMEIYNGKFPTAPRPWEHHDTVREFVNNCGCTAQQRIDLAMAWFDGRLDKGTFGWIKLWFTIDDQIAQEKFVHEIFSDAMPKWMGWGIDWGRRDLCWVRLGS